MKEVYIKTRGEWRKWLDRNHGKSSGVWLVFYKKHTGKATLGYDDAVEEALCFGWIDSIIKRVDDERYVRKLTPRRANSQWSELNKKRARKLVKQGLMTESGLAALEAGRTKGGPEICYEMPAGLKKALGRNKRAKKFFDQLAPTYQKYFIGWVTMAKREETKDRRICESISLLEQGKKLGLK